MAHTCGMEFILCGIARGFGGFETRARGL